MAVLDALTVVRAEPNIGAIKTNQGFLLSPHSDAPSLVQEVCSSFSIVSTPKMTAPLPYSDFFSSGFLAPLHIPNNGFPVKGDGDDHTDADMLPSPLAAAAMDYVSSVDHTIAFSSPTIPAETFPLKPNDVAASAAPLSVIATAPNAIRPRLRKRRSSLTVSAASPVVSSIKSPTKNAGTAWQIQRTRSGSLSAVVHGGEAVAWPRIRRQMTTASRPQLPPPSAPLPAVPACAPASPPQAFQQPQFLSGLRSAPPFLDRMPLMQRAHSYQDQLSPTYSPAFSSFGDIDEMKEN